MFRVLRQRLPKSEWVRARQGRETGVGNRISSCAGCWFHSGSSQHPGSHFLSCCYHLRVSVERFLQLCWWPLAFWIETSPHFLPLSHRTLLCQQIKIIKIIFLFWIIFVVKILLGFSPGALLYQCPLAHSSASKIQTCEASGPPAVNQSTHCGTIIISSSAAPTHDTTSGFREKGGPFCLAYGPPCLASDQNHSKFIGTFPTKIDKDSWF